MPLTLCSSLLQYTSLNIFKHFSTCKVLGNHYETLNLSRNCSAQEVKESFIKLSKENHPDVNKSKDAHKKFLQIKEAYNVLSKRQSRQLYDLTLEPYDGDCYRRMVRVPYKEQCGTDPWKDPLFYMNRNKADDKKYEGRPYYGIKGLKRVSNATIAMLCVTIAAVVLGIQVMLIRHSFTFNRNELLKRSNLAEEALRQAREAAKRNGNKLQLQLLMERIEKNKKRKEK